MLRLSPFLLFHGKCAEAMEFYHACFGGLLTLTPLFETPMNAQYPKELHSRITYALLKSDAVEIAGTDWLHPPRRPQQGNTTAIYIQGESRDALQPIFEKLRLEADPALLVELQDMPFGVYGRLTDRYGVEWFFRGGA